MALSLLVSSLLLLTLFLGPLGVYAYALGRFRNQLPAFAAGSMLLLGLMALAMAIAYLSY